ncbi:uncharacterized protein E0L32_012063 [Thyridium curvatum]|uniref:Uncharacterized protein n=1 Tax=Thyridium curvatum TaxID=1093900 RepID=A0A507B5Y0_9PEZI|nr:uncharacterized protein E0L32_012063 [Thyridium curvatum]TPX17652.1 hypothetical protein E0L32_012063 [Thyridium curvatum]
MEGVFLVPPDRGALIGRALWKPRFVTIGGPQREPAHSNNRAHANRSSTPKGQQITDPDAVYLSVYKSSSDYEPAQQHAIGSITDCQIQLLSHRKQGPPQATLVISISPDPTTDKLRKRRSSRTAGLTSTKETSPSTLLFRQGDPDGPTLREFLQHLQAVMRQAPPTLPMSPITPASPTFINPFSPRSRDASDYQRPGSGHAATNSTLSHKGSSHTGSSKERERPVTFSEAQSLRSRRSDISHASSMNPSRPGFTIQPQAYGRAYPADLPSPATTVGEYQGEFIEGWTSAQGRSSVVSSPVRGRDSIDTQPSAAPRSIVDSSSPPGPRETILDRAFQLRCIPGSERQIPGEEKLSSLARFDALMREVDQKQQRSKPKPVLTDNDPGMKSAWDLDEDDSDSDDSIIPEEDEDPDRELASEHDIDGSVYMPASAQRALFFITSRHEPQPSRSQSSRSPASFDAETLRTLNSGYPHPRPQTGYARSRPGMAQRTHSQPQLAGNSAAKLSLLDIPASSIPAKTPEEQISARGSVEKRASNSSTVRLSFTDFTRRLSSTSSLLLVQTNTSGGSSRGSTSEAELQQTAVKGNLNPRGVPPPPVDRDRCGWRGSVGVLAPEGGFL